GMYAARCGQCPSFAATMGATPLIATCSRNNAPAPANVEPLVDWMRAPAESSSQTNGIRCRTESSRSRAILCSPTWPIDPAITVKSYAPTATGRPSISPIPVTTPSAARNRSPRPASMWSASIPYSTHVPGSSSTSRRSRTVSLPSECCRSMRSGPPISRARSRRAFRSPTSGPQSWTSPPPVVVTTSSSHGEQAPLAGDTLQLVRAAVGELDTGAGHEALPPLPLRLAFLGERRDTLGGVLGPGRDREHRLEIRERVVGVHVEHVVEALTPPPEDQRRLRRKSRGQLFDGVVELGGGHDPRDEPDAPGLRGVDTPARHHPLEGSLGQHQTQERHGDHVRPQAAVALGRAELSVVGRHHEVARQGEAEPAREGIAAHARDRRFSEAPEVAEQRGENTASLVGGGGVLLAGDPSSAEVRTGAERLVARPGEDQHGLVGLRPRDCLPQPLHHVEGHRVPSVGSIDRRARDCPCDLVANVRHGEIVETRTGEPPVVRLKGVVSLAVVAGVACLVVVVTGGSVEQLFRSRLPSISMFL